MKNSNGDSYSDVSSAPTTAHHHQHHQTHFLANTNPLQAHILILTDAYSHSCQCMRQLFPSCAFRPLLFTLLNRRHPSTIKSLHASSSKQAFAISYSCLRIHTTTYPNSSSLLVLVFPLLTPLNLHHPSTNKNLHTSLPKLILVSSNSYPEKYVFPF